MKRKTGGGTTIAKLFGIALKNAKTGSKRPKKGKKGSAAKRKTCRKASLWTAAAIAAYVAVFSIAGAYVMRDTAENIAAKRAACPWAIFSQLEYFGNWTLFATDALGITGDDVVYGFDEAAPEGEIFFAGAPVRTAAPAPRDIRIIERSDFAIGWSDSLRHAVWVAYHVPQKPRYRSGPRPSFAKDPEVASSPSAGAYTHSGYDRGHLAPNHAIATRFGPQAQKETFLTSNIAPQTPNLNRGVWREVELSIADLWTARYGEIWVVAGAIPAKGGEKHTLADGIDIPGEYYMVIVAQCPASANGKGGNEEPYEIRALAVKFPQDVETGVFPMHHLVSIDSLEKETGLDFLPDLPGFVQSPLEAQTPTRIWPVNFFDFFSLLKIHLSG